MIYDEPEDLTCPYLRYMAACHQEQRPHAGLLQNGNLGLAISWKHGVQSCCVLLSPCFPSFAPACRPGAGAWLLQAKAMCSKHAAMLMGSPHAPTQSQVL